MRKPFLVALAITIAGCSNHDSSTSHQPNPAPGTTPTTPEITFPPNDAFASSPYYQELSQAQSSDAELAPAGQDQLEEAIKNGIRLRTIGRWSLDAPVSPGVNMSFIIESSARGDVSAEASRGTDAQRTSFSAQNTHVKGVEEADWAQFDGEHWFISTPPNNIDQTLASAGIEIVTTDPATATATEVGFISFNEFFRDIDQEFYLVKEEAKTTHLASIYSKPFMTTLEYGFDSLKHRRPNNGEIQISLFNVEDPANPSEDFNLTIEGNLVESRKIGDMLYVISHYGPWLPELELVSKTDVIYAENEALIAGASFDQLMPTYTLNGEKQFLVSDCLMPLDWHENQALSSLTNITAIDLKNRTLLPSLCINSSFDTTVVTEEHLYLMAALYSRSESSTLIHKFSLDDDGPHYSAKGNVPGTMNHRSDPEFRMHEHGDDLRLVTSQWRNGNLEHTLFILEQQGKTLATVATLPNTDRPEAIGKPGEDIFAVRFDENNAYIVTFLQIDPLYKIDLTDRLDPKIAGELEVTGFANYMHPLGENHLLTLGHEADELGIDTGIKVELVDVSGEMPKVVEKLVLGDRGSYSSALHDLKDLNVLQVSADEYRIAFPIHFYFVNVDAASEILPPSGLQLLEVKGIEAGVPTLEDAGLLDVSNPLSRNDYYGGNSRGLLQDDAVFFTRGGAIWSSFWSSPETAGEPLHMEPPPCNDEPPVNGLQIHLFSNSTTADTCNATVIATEGTYSEQLQATPYRSDAGEQGCLFAGAEERTGTFDVTVQLDGHESIMLGGYTVFQSRCHVVPVDLHFTMTEARN